jgi:hypothetical protein
MRLAAAIAVEQIVLSAHIIPCRSSFIPATFNIPGRVSGRKPNIENNAAAHPYPVKRAELIWRKHLQAGNKGSGFRPLIFKL